MKQINFVTVPYSAISLDLDAFLMKTSLRIGTAVATKIGEMLKPKYNSTVNEDSIVYKIPCENCPSSYYGGTGRGLEKRMAEHRIAHRTSNSYVAHGDKYGHLPGWSNVVILDRIALKIMRKAKEDAYINSNKCINYREGFVWLANAASFSVINDLRGHNTG